MSTNFELAKKDLRNMKDQWKSLPDNIKMLDKFAFGQLILFVIAYLFTSILDIKLTTSNATMVIIPIFLAGFTFMLRMNIMKGAENTSKARREFLMFFVIMIILFFITILYGIYLG